MNTLKDILQLNVKKHEYSKGKGKNKVIFTSATTLIHKFFEPFDIKKSSQLSYYKRKREDPTITPAKIRKEWKKIHDIGLKHSKEQESACKSRALKGEKNGMYGKDSWSKGLTKVDHGSLKTAGQKISLERKKSKELNDGRWNISGEKNPMYGKPSPMAGKTYEKIKCEYCGKEVSRTKIKLFHGINCKMYIP